MCAETLGISFHQLFCRAGGCGAMFFICRSCYRGHGYCSDPCRRETRRIQRREANRRYEQDPEVRKDHRNRQREWRERQCGGRVTDPSSNCGCDWSSMSAPPTETGNIHTPPAERIAPNPTKPAWGGRFRWIVCAICGRVGRFIAAFTRRE